MTVSDPAVRKRTDHPLIIVGAVVGALLLLYYPAVIVFGSAGDVDLYRRYAGEALSRPISLPTEYPALTAVLFVLPQLLLPTHYMLGFALLAALAAAATVFVVQRLGGGRWRLLLLLLLAGWGTLFFRFDIFVILLTVLAYAAASRQRWVAAQALLALAVALKLYPITLMPLVVLAEWHTTRRLPVRSVVGGAACVLLALGGTWLAAPDAGTQVVGLLGERPLQFEAVGASLAWLLGPTATELTFGSINLVSPLAPLARTLMTIASVPALLGAYALFGMRRLGSARAWALTLVVLVATSKVFSTQYVLWVLPFVVLALASDAAAGRTRAARDDFWLWLAICLLTGLVFPFGEKFHSRTAQLALAALRNGLWLVAALRLANLGISAGVLRRLRLGLALPLQLLRRRPLPALALAALLLGLDVLALRVATTRAALLDVGAWNDEERLRLNGFYLPEESDDAVSYRWSGPASTLRVRGSAATMAPLAAVFSFGGLPVPEQLTSTVDVVLDKVETLTLGVPQMPRRFHVLVPPTAADGGIEIMLRGPTTRVGDDPRELGVRVDALTVGALSSGLILPTWQTLGVQLIALWCGSAAVTWLGGRRLRLVLLPVMALGLALLAAAYPWAPWNWQSRVLSAALLVLLATWGWKLGRGRAVQVDAPASVA